MNDLERFNKRLKEWASKEETGEIERVIETMYASDSNHKNFYAKLGWKLFNDGFLDKAVFFFKRDLQLGRLCANSFLMYAQVLSAKGNVDEASKVVRKVYKTQNHLKDGWSRVGFELEKKGELLLGRRFYHKDYCLGKASLPWLKRYASLLGVLSYYSSAEEKIQKIYQFNEDAKDLNIMVSRGAYSSGDISNSLRFILKDLKAQRCSEDSVKYAVNILYDFKNKSEILSQFQEGDLRKRAEEAISDIDNKGLQHETELQQKVKQHLSFPVKKKLLAVYDFGELPYSFDSITFFQKVDIYCKLAKCDSVDLALLAQGEDPSPDRSTYVNENWKKLLVNEFIEPSLLFKKIHNVFLFTDRKEFKAFYSVQKEKYMDVFPKEYNVDCPLEMQRKDRLPSHSWKDVAFYYSSKDKEHSLRPVKSDLLLARKWLKANVFPKLGITITLREWEGWIAERNSHIPSWQRICDFYSSYDIKFIVLRDYDKLYEPPNLKGENVVYCNEAVISSSFRAALYQESYFNCMALNGPWVFCSFNPLVRYLIFNFGLKQPGIALNIYRNLGLSKGEQLHGAKPFQKLIWKEDNFENIRDELSKVLGEMKSLCLDKEWLAGF